MNTTYPSDLSDTEWECLQHYLRETRSTCRTRRHSLRSILNAIFYVLRTGCPWRYLPSNFPPWQTVFDHFRRLRLRGRWAVLFTALHDAERQRAGRDPHPSAAIMDAQSVKTVEESAHISGFDAYKRVKGRKRHLLVDTLGIPLSYYVTPADMHDTQGARRFLGGLKYFVPRLKIIWADSAYRGKDLADWCKEVGDWDLEVVGHELWPGFWKYLLTRAFHSEFRRNWRKTRPIFQAEKLPLNFKNQQKTLSTACFQVRYQQL
jgi:putative transposase